MTASTSPNTKPVVHHLPERAYSRMTLVLRVGLGLALVILASGLVTYWLTHPGADSSSVLSQNPVGQYVDLSALGRGLLDGSLGAFLALGLLVLVATPIVRVLSGLYYFRQAGERAMATITLTVFLLLLVGILVIGPLVR